MEYCIRGAANIWGGHTIELTVEMEEWLVLNCQSPYAIVHYDEVKFSRRADAVAFARQWFETGYWRLREMGTHCRVGSCHGLKHKCHPTEFSTPVPISSFPTLGWPLARR